MKAQPAIDVEIESRVQEVVHAATERKAVGLEILHLAEVSDFTDYFLIMSGTSDRHVEAVAEAILDRLKAEKVRPLHVEGLPQSSWVLLDFGDFVVHIFREDTRRFYSLERLWGDAPHVTEQFTT